MGGNCACIKKQVPTLSIFGRNDPYEMILEENADYHNGFKGYFDEYSHEGKHEIPIMSKQLHTKISGLLQFSGVECVLEKNDELGI